MYDDTKNSPISAYQPNDDVKHFTNQVKKDWYLGDQILNRPWMELNGRSIIEDENRGQMMFNAFVDTSVEDPAEAWKWRGTRSQARNKGIAMHAQLTANFLLPTFMAQNENDDVDRDFSEVMRDIIEWMTAPTNSNYQSSFFQIVFSMMTNPVTYLGAEYCEVMQQIKERQADGSYTTKEILDEVLSGFQAPIWSSTQVLLTNAYQRDIQKQRRVIKRRYVEKQELEAKWGQHPNWVFVQEGVRSIYNEENGLFYDVKDKSQRAINLVAEETAMSRRQDSEVTFINGIYFGAENIEDNPMHHRDNRNAPKYNVTPFGYYRIGDHFFYYKSMMNALGWDNALYDAMSEVAMNRALLEADPPVAITGSDKVDSDMVFPTSVVSFENENTKVTPLLPPANFGAIFSAMGKTDESMSNASLSETSMGQVPTGTQRAYVVAAAQANAKKLIADVAKSLAESVVWFGDLMKDIALNHLTTPQIDELEDGTMSLKYRSFILQNKTSGGRMGNKRIVLDKNLIGKELTPEEKKYASLRMLTEYGYPESKDAIIHLNPEFFAKFKYLTKADTEEMFKKNQEYWQPILTQLYTTLRQDPLVKADLLVRKLMYSYFQHEGDELVNDNPPTPGMPALPGAQPNPQQDTPSNQFAQQTTSKMMGQVSTGAVAQ